MKHQYKIYREIQVNWFVNLILFGIPVWMTFAYIHQWGNNPLTIAPLIVVSLLVIIPGVLFYKMETLILGDSITVRYGIGLVSKTIPMKEIRSVKFAKGRWVNGAGIRVLNNGTLYNINFTDSVELAFKHSGRVIQIGTKDPQSLEKAIKVYLDRTYSNDMYR